MLEHSKNAASNSTIAAALQQVPTPFYLFDCAVLQTQIAQLRAAMPARVQLCYAMKANPFIVREAGDAVERVEVCSTGEYRTCEATGVPPEKIVLSGIAKDESLLRELIGSGTPILRYTAESPLQYDMLEAIACEFERRIPVLLRLTSGNQFGIDADALVALAKRAVASPFVEFCGVQYFSGTQKSSAKRYKRELEKASRFISKLEQGLGISVPEFEYGGGLPVEYFGEDPEAALQSECEMAVSLGEQLAAMPFDSPIIVELGRAIAASCGTYATRVVDTKCNTGNNFAVVDGGMHQLVYYGHAMALQQPFCRVVPQREAPPNAAAAEDALWNVCGSLCTTSDILVKQMPFGNLQVGDVILFEKAGAYCMTEGHAAFLSRDLPQIVIADKAGELRIARSRFETHTLNTPGKWI